MKPCGLLLIFLFPLISFSQNRYDVVISEIMPDPAPQVGLPNNEWIELKNTSNVPINLINWRIGDLSGQSGPLPNFTLQPDSFVVVCTGSAVAAMSAFGPTISVTSFPSLDNDGDQVFLRAANGRTIHCVNYSLSWHQNTVKQEGGWTLEMIDPGNPCAGAGNWNSSSHLNGGTPGRKNSIDAINNDSRSPQLIRAFTTDSATIILVFDEPLDSLAGATLTNYTIDGGISLASVTTIAPLFTQVQLKTTTPLDANIIYTITAQNIKDCKGNTISAYNKVKVGLAADAAAGEWIINEILFNPRSNAFDFIEFYNNSNKIFDASRLFIANRNSAGLISSVKPLNAVPFFIFPGDHIVVTEDEGSLGLQYLVKNPGNVLLLSSPPSFPDDEGTVVALNFQGTIVDEVKYKANWHFKLVDNAEGISLERIDHSGPSQNSSNWHSAASTAGYATPTYKNSQYKMLNTINATLEIAPKVFSPDNDGLDDIASIQYEVSEPGYVANIVIYDAAGRAVKNLVRNGTLSLTGYWNWEGLDDKGNKLPVGTYVVFTEIFNLRGKKEIFRKAVVLARPLR